MRRLITIVSLSVLTVPFIALAAGATTLRDLVNYLVKIINAGAGFLILIAVLIYFVGVVGLLFQSGQGSTKGKMSLRSYLMGGMAVLFVMVSIWGIINLIQQTIFGSLPSSGTNTEANVPTFNSI